MQLEQIDAALRDEASEVRRGDNIWEFEVDEVHMACICDPHFDRMRVVAGVTRVADLEPRMPLEMLEANFHSALDVRYAISDGIVYAAFIHPLGALQDDEFRSALQQVSWAVQTFGDSYSSGELIFGGGNGDDRVQ